MKVVLDANVLVSAALSGSGSPGRIVTMWNEAAFELLTSITLLHELEVVFGRQRLLRQLGWSAQEGQDFVEALRSAGTIVNPDIELEVVQRDPDDNRVLEAAVAGEADYIVSGDRDLLDLGEYGGIRILRPAEFVALLESQQP